MKTVLSSTILAASLLATLNSANARKKTKPAPDPTPTEPAPAPTQCPGPATAYDGVALGWYCSWWGDRVLEINSCDIDQFASVLEGPSSDLEVCELIKSSVPGAQKLDCTEFSQIVGLFDPAVIRNFADTGLVIRIDWALGEHRVAYGTTRGELNLLNDESVCNF